MAIIIIMVRQIQITRDYAKDFNVNKTRLVYGRRKTGKSFYVENFVKYDAYLFVYRDKSIKNIKTNDSWSFDELKRYILNNKEKTIVIDEFHRLDSSFLDFLHSIRANNLILITSSLHFANSVLSKKSPVLGLIYPIKFKIFTPCEILGFMAKAVKTDFLEYSILLREPALLDFFEGGDFKSFLLKYYNFAKYWTIALFGEIFEDEDRKLTNVYDGIIRAISLGKSSSGEISSHLFSNGLIPKDSPGAVSSYLEILSNIGIIEKKEVYGKRRLFKYALVSSALDFFFYLNSKYGENVTEREIMDGWNNKVSFYIESFLESLLSEYYGYEVVKYSYPNKEIDVCLKKFKKVEVIGSVKWKDISKVNFVQVKQNLNLDVQNKFLFVKYKGTKKKEEGIFIYDEKDVIKFCKSFK